MKTSLLPQFGKKGTILPAFLLFIFLMSLLFFCTGCTKSEVDIKPVEIKPIHITIDINLKVDRALDNYFGDLDKLEKKQ